MTQRIKRPLRYRGFNVRSRPSAFADLAPWWRRVIAYLIDAAIVVGLTEGMYFALGHRSYIGRADTEHEWLLRLVVLAVVGSLYYPPLMTVTNGQTLGKLLLKIRVIRTDGERMTPARALWRQVAIQIVAFNVVSYWFYAYGLFGLGLLDGVWPLWDRESRAIHDMLAGTRVKMA
jgi:uncharacterized RDD family membrane protein YckC